MINFTEGDHVIVMDHNTLKRGVIRDIYLDLRTPIAIVEIEGGVVKKVLIDQIARDEEVTQEPKEAPKKTKVVEKSEITLTSEHFDEIVTELSDELPDVARTGMIAILLASVLAKVKAKLFLVEVVDND